MVAIPGFYEKLQSNPRRRELLPTRYDPVAFVIIDVFESKERVTDGYLKPRYEFGRVFLSPVADEDFTGQRGGHKSDFR